MNRKNRRKALKALAVGAPIVWAKPVVDSVVLPAHASTTCLGCVDVTGGGDFFNFNCNDFIPCDSQEYRDSMCTDPNGDASNNRVTVYAPGGQVEAEGICNRVAASTPVSQIGSTDYLGMRRLSSLGLARNTGPRNSPAGRLNTQ